MSTISIPNFKDADLKEKLNKYYKKYKDCGYDDREAIENSVDDISYDLSDREGIRKHFEYYMFRELCSLDIDDIVLEWGNDSDTYTSVVDEAKMSRVIHIGLRFGLTSDGTPWFDSFSSWLSRIRYLMDHEIGHIYQTALKPWKSMQINSYKGFIEYACKRATGKPIRLIKDSDYDEATKMLGEKYGIHFNRRMLRSFIHMVGNSIEDGRMERKEFQKKAGFKADAILYYAMYYMHTPIVGVPDLNSPETRCIIMLNQILSYATCGKLQKGYIKCCINTQLDKDFKMISNTVKDAVMANSCRIGMDKARAVCKQIYPYFYEACQYSEFEKKLMDFVSQIASMVGLSSDGEVPGTFSANEITSEDENLPQSQLTGAAPPKQMDVFAESGSKGQRVDPNAENDSEDIERAMEEAVKQAEKKAASTERSIGEALVNESKSTVSEHTDDSIPPDMKDICSSYNEFTRKYKLDIELPANIKLESRQLRRKYEEVLQQKKKYVDRGCKSGKIDPRALVKIPQRDLSFFMRSGIDDSFSGCIEIRIDNSGSMNGYKKKCACEASARIEELLKGLLPLKITAFDSQCNVEVEVIKNWEESFNKNCSWNYYKYGRTGGGTPTTEALLTAQRELLSRNESKKLLILMTDESSSCSAPVLKDAIRKIRRSGIQLCGVYFENEITDKNRNDFEDLFDGVDTIVCNPQEISRNLLPVIKRFARI